MSRTRTHGASSKECCRLPLQGTMDGYAHHHSTLKTPPCPPCMAARTAYLGEQVERWAAYQPVTRAQRGIRAFVEDYLYLITTGETHPESIAARLGTNQRALERRLYRVGLHVLHQPRPRPDQKLAPSRRRLAVAA